MVTISQGCTAGSDYAEVADARCPAHGVALLVRRSPLRSPARPALPTTRHRPRFNVGRRPTAPGLTAVAQRGSRFRGSRRLTSEHHSIRMQFNCNADGHRQGDQGGG
jgi:hypothetical protein